MKKVLLVTDVDFWVKNAGNKTRIRRLVTYLADKVQLTVVFSCPVPGHVEMILRDAFRADFFILEKNKHLDSNGYGRKFRAFLKDKKFDTIIIEYIHCSYFLNFLIYDVQVILDAHDIISDRADEFQKNGHSGVVYELSREKEIGIFKIYDYVAVLCEPDYLKVNAVLGPDKTLLCPHPVIPSRHRLRQEVRNIVFVASAFLPNVDAIIAFITHCWPVIIKKHAVQLQIYGTVCYVLSDHAGDNIVLKGFVTDEDEIYSNADIVINPVKFGAGLKIKNIEALGHGVPLVTTPHGARGIERGMGNAFLVADNDVEFIRAVESVIVDLQLRIKLSENAIRLIADSFSAESCFQPLMNAIG